MTRAMRDMEEKRTLCDGVICVLDARAPAATFNQNLQKIFGGKPILYLLNKADLADGGAEEFRKLIADKGKHCLLCNAADAASGRALTRELAKMTEEKRVRAQDKGFSRTFRFMVAGIPNTGKSTVVNLLGGRHRAKTGDKAGVTRDVRWLKCGAFDLLDTPGTMPPAFSSQLLDKEDIALELLGELAEMYPGYLSERYGISDFSDKTAMYEAVCRRRGFVLKGGEYDYERGANALLDDFRKGRIGRVCLERAADYADLSF
mgnify:FL=1